MRDVATFKLWAQAIQAMLQQALGIECKLRTVVESVWFDDIKSGNFDMAVGAVVSTLLDPSDYFNAWYKKDGPQNYSGWDNAEFNPLMPQIDGEVDPAKRLALIRKAEEIMEQDVPLFPSAGRRSTTSGTTTSKVTIPRTTSASTTSCAWTPCGSTRLEGHRERHRNISAAAPPGVGRACCGQTSCLLR